MADPLNVLGQTLTHKLFTVVVPLAFAAMECVFRRGHQGV
jgi:hypothetical protein